jgi:hypothetical protein
MGRYWNTNTGRGGKFGFGCQPSEDPQNYFEMTPTSVVYGGAYENIVKQKVDEIYDKAGVPKEERVYQLDGSDNEYDSFHNDYHKYFFETCEPNEGNFAGDNGTTEKERFDKAHLCQSRLWLGLVILSDINDDGYCSIEAEM